jgi:hypothetical protein
MLKTFLLVSLLTMPSLARACCDIELKEPSTAVQVIAPSFTATKTDGPALLTVLGTFRNTTESTVSDLVVEAKLLDASGKVIDVLTQPVYGVLVQAGQDVAFRMQGAAAEQPSAYASVQARVTSGETQQSRQPRAEKDDGTQLSSLLMSWGPMLLLIVVWIYMARKYSGKGSVQDRTLDLIAEQNAILSKQLAAIESIAAAAEGSRPKNDA